MSLGVSGSYYTWNEKVTGEKKAQQSLRVK
jgi:hypothetical protein